MGLYYEKLVFNKYFGILCALKTCLYGAGKHLAEHCRAEYPKVPNFILWILAELAVVACDIPEGITTSSLMCTVAHACPFYF